MKTIFRSLSTGAVLALVLAMGAVAVSAQDPCTDADGQTKWRDNFTAIFPNNKTSEGYKVRIETAKSGLEKYGNCESFADMKKYINDGMAKWEETYKKLVIAEEKARLIKRFDDALKVKNWDESYAAGREILAKYPDEFRTVEIVLGSIGGEEAFKANFKYADDTIKYAKQSIADLEAGKSFAVNGKERLGLSLQGSYNFEYKNKEEALGYLNLYVGYIMQVNKKDKAGAAPYLYKATQAASDAKNNPIPFGLIGYYYADQGDKLADEIQALIKAQNPTDTEEVAKQKVDVIKAKVAISNGTNLRAADAFSRAYTLAKDATYKAEIKKALDFSYNRRYGKMEGLDAYIANALKQPFENPSNPVKPDADPEPVTTTTTGTSVGAATGTGVGAGNGTGTGAGNGSGMGAANGTGIGNKAAPATTTTPVKNTTTTAPKATTPAKKPGASLKKKTTAKKIV